MSHLHARHAIRNLCDVLDDPPAPPGTVDRSIGYTGPLRELAAVVFIALCALVATTDAGATALLWIVMFARR